VDALGHLPIKYFEVFGGLNFCLSDRTGYLRGLLCSCAGVARLFPGIVIVRATASLSLGNLRFNLVKFDIENTDCPEILDLKLASSARRVARSSSCWIRSASSDASSVFASSISC